jgi:HSP20 family protein
MMRRKDFIWDTGWTMNLFNRMVQEVSGKFPTAPESAGETSEPAMDIFEDDKDVIIDVEVPGLNREDLRVRIDEDHVCIEGYKRGGKDVTCLTYLCLERQYGAFRRIVKIPGSVDTTSIQAVLRDGVLRIRLPRISDRRKSTFEVQIGE